MSALDVVSGRIIRAVFRPTQTRRVLLVLGLTLGAGCLVWVLPGVDRLERDVTLPWLFASRGARPPPPEALIVSIDSESARRLDLPARFAEWPRQVYADLIRRLSAAGAGVIAIDVYFAHPRMGAGDAALASAITDAGNVVLFGKMQREVEALPQAGVDGQVLVDRVRWPYRRFAGAAAAVAPFVLPKAPARVDRVWLYHPAAPTLATLPAAALRVQARGGVCPAGPKATAVQRAACDLAAGEPERLLNFYGPPWSVRVLSTADVLQGGLPPLNGAAVFIGHIERYFPNQLDSFPTVVGRSDGLDLSGVEIAATAYLNLLRDEFLVAPSAAWVVGGLALSAVALTALFTALGVVPALVLAVAWSCGVFLAVALGFSRGNLWLPLAPWLVQIGTVLVASMSFRARSAAAERTQVVEAFRPYLPAHVVRWVERDTVGGLLADHSTPVQVVCLITDAAGYTAVGERLSARQLRDLANRYFAALLAPIQAHQGIVTDIVGDSALAVWPLGQSGVAARLRACQAAAGIQAAVAGFELPGGGRLATRVGLHVGEVMLGPVGAGEHFEYRAIGDVVNTASRIEALSKQLGTHVLATAAVVDGLSGVAYRRVGRFVLAGKMDAVDLYELTGPIGTPRAAPYGLFEEALAVCATGNAAAAATAFRAVLAADPNDPVAAFYVAALAQGNRLRHDGAIVTGKG